MTIDPGGRAGGGADERRVPLIEQKEGLDEASAEVFEWVVASRGKMIRPFEVLLHTPQLAQKVAELGHVVRYESALDPADRELAILSTGRALGCGFVWDSHQEPAARAGVRPEVVEALEHGSMQALAPDEATIVAFAFQLCNTSAVDDETFNRAHRRLGDQGVVELALTVGYYTMLGFAMSAAGAC